MSRRHTTSFFEQDNSATNKSAFFPRKNTDQQSRNVAPSLPASAETRSKLSAFAYTGALRSTQEAYGGNHSIETHPDSESLPLGALPTPKKPITDNMRPTPTKTTLAPASQEAPQTPAPRLSIFDLLGPEEEKRITSEHQPDDMVESCVSWARSTPGGGNSRNKVGGTKRSASSSPPPFRTPVAKHHPGGLLNELPPDPAMQLWKKYSTGSVTEDIRPSSNPAARLFLPGGTDRSPSGLRRSYTAPETSSSHHRPKRRKTTASEVVGDLEMIDVREERSTSHSSMKIGTRQSRVANLMDRVKQTMYNSTEKHKPVLSPGTIGYEDMFSSAPADARESPNGSLTTTGLLLSSDTEDFGDFDDADLDMTQIEEIEKAASTANDEQSSQVAAQAQKITSKPLASENSNSCITDEFDEFDDALFTADLEKLMSQYDAPVLHDNGGIGSSGNHPDAPKKVKRCHVVEITEGHYQKAALQPRRQSVMRVRDESGAFRRIILRDSWVQSTPVLQGAVVHVIGDFDDEDICVVDNQRNYIVVNPDVLVSATTVADSVGCMRKAVLQDRVKATSDISKPMVYGNIIHTLFQAALEGHDFSTAVLHLHIDRIVSNNIESLYLLREEIADAIAYVRAKVPLLQEWAKIFLSARPNYNATVADHRGRGAPKIAINKLLDIEEHIWAPSYGLKGNIDATVQAVVIEHDGKDRKTLAMPLELKTGRNTQATAHRAQTMLYTLLMSDRYDMDVQNGLLYYMETAEMMRIPAVRNELRELISKRNQVAIYMHIRESLPEMLRDDYACSRCYAKTPCFVYHKLLEGGTEESSGAIKTFGEITQHLEPKHQDFFRHWDTLLTKEEKDSMRFRQEIWTMASGDRESAGRCFSGLVVVPGSVVVDQGGQKINKFTYSFEKRMPLPNFNFLESQINEGDPIVVSDEQGHYALAIGYVFRIREAQITVQVDRHLHDARIRQPDFNETYNQAFKGMVDFQTREQAQPSMASSRTKGPLYRVDKDQFSNGMASVRNNLIQLMAPQANKYRRLIVDLEAPFFKDSPAAYELDDPAIQGSLNPDQRRAIEKVMTARDYALVLGMPGTGKTTTIAHIIRALVLQGKSVLLTSYTHTAVDNILLKIKDEKFAILRLGSRSKIQHEVQAFAQLTDSSKTTFEELRLGFSQPKVVATTCLGINHAIFSEREFDYCIVDEASQITLPVCLGPIRYAKTFILVGDHFQLPPLVKNIEARDGGLDVSLFRLLSEAHPHAVVNLEHQYRMCRDIMTLSNELIYSGRLKCGTAEVADRALILPDEKGLHNIHPNNSDCLSGCWLADLFAPAVRACFANTDSVPALEEKKGDRTVNSVEAELVLQIVEGFLSCGVDASSIGVITVYRSQLKVIRHLLRGRPKVEMHTADKFQGRDKEVIVISLVRSNNQGSVGDLLQDWRRINVAFTRARSKLIIIGSRTTLSSNALLNNFVALMDSNRWMYNLRTDAHLIHRMGKDSSSGLSPYKTPGKVPLGNSPSPKRISGKAAGKNFLGNRPVLRNIMNEIA